MKTLFISYNGALEPLGQTQVIPYLRELSRHGVEVSLLTFEKSHRLSNGRGDIRAMGDRLARDGIAWRYLRYHKTPSLPATLYDISLGTGCAAVLIRRKGIGVVHARSHVPAAMALTLKRLLGVKFIFDLRGFLAEEYEDAGIWRRDSLNFKLTKALERRFLTCADGLVVLTEKAKEFLLQTTPQLRNSGVNIQVIPCCVDIAKFRLSDEVRQQQRESLGLTDKTVLVYLGQLGSWYLAREMVEFFVVARQRIPHCRFLIVTPSDPTLIEPELVRCEVGREDCTILSSPPDGVPRHLAAADVGISFIKPCFSKIASSPTKIGEYLAAGLPIVTNAGVGDCGEFVSHHQVGVVIEEFTEQAYAQAVDGLLPLLRTGADVRSHCRMVAEEYLSLERVGGARYLEVYRSLQ